MSWLECLVHKIERACNLTTVHSSLPPPTAGWRQTAAQISGTHLWTRRPKQGLHNHAQYTAGNPVLSGSLQFRGTTLVRESNFDMGCFHSNKLLSVTLLPRYKNISLILLTCKGYFFFRNLNNFKCIFCYKAIFVFISQRTNDFSRLLNIQIYK